MIWPKKYHHTAAQGTPTFYPQRSELSLKEAIMSVFGDSRQTHGRKKWRKWAEVIKGRDEFEPGLVEARGSLPNSYAHTAVLNDDIIPADRCRYTRETWGKE